MTLITRKGLDNLKEELEKRSEDRDLALNAMSKARDLGDISENSELDAAKNNLERCQSDIAQLRAQISSAIVFDPATIKEDEVGFGAIVTVEDEDSVKFTYHLLGPAESDISKNIISITSPIGNSMLGRKIGESFKVIRPIGEKEYTILDISYSNF